MSDYLKGTFLLDFKQTNQNFIKQEPVADESYKGSQIKTT